MSNYRSKKIYHFLSPSQREFHSTIPEAVKIYLTDIMYILTVFLTGKHRSEHTKHFFPNWWIHSTIREAIKI